MIAKTRNSFGPQLMRVNFPQASDSAIKRALPKIQLMVESTHVRTWSNRLGGIGTSPPLFGFQVKILRRAALEEASPRYCRCDVQRGEGLLPSLPAVITVKSNSRLFTESGHRYAFTVISLPIPLPFLAIKELSHARSNVAFFYERDVESKKNKKKAAPLN